MTIISQKCLLTKRMYRNQFFLTIIKLYCL